MHLSSLDWIIIGTYFILILIIGLGVARQAGKSASEFFLSGRNMPWWLLGVSMVATTFSADTPNLVTNIVRQDGVAGNWAWWAFLLTGMLTVFVYARMWRRSGVLTDLEFYEIRYGGKPAAFLRGFRAIYLGVVFNILIMATVCLAAIKIGGAMLGLDPWVTVLGISLITVVYSSFGGLRGVLLTDFIQFILAMIGSVWAVFVILDLPEVQGLQSILTHPDIVPRLSFWPSMEDREAWLTLLILPIAVQWWSVWYPGSEPGGGGYVAQRMLAAKDEGHAVGATFLYNAAHYALRPWPWLLIALASIMVLPLTLREDRVNEVAVSEEARQFLEEEVAPTDLANLGAAIEHYQAENAADTGKVAGYARLQHLLNSYPDHPEIASLAFLAREKGSDPDDPTSWADPLAVEQLVSLHLANPTLSLSKLGQDLAYPTMLRYLPPGLIGLMLASLLAAVMSTLSTHLNWGASYVAHDAYRRFVKADATDQDLVGIGRWTTAGLMVLAALMALLLSDALQSFQILLQIGAGTGLIFILRWFWWRINAWSEISAMIISFVVAIVLQLILPNLNVELSAATNLLLGVGITTAGWLIVTFLTPPDKQEVLRSFYERIKPSGPGWDHVLLKARANGNPIEDYAERGQLPLQILAMVLGTVAIYGALFATGYWIYGEVLSGVAFSAVSLGAALLLYGLWQRIKD